MNIDILNKHTQKEIQAMSEIAKELERLSPEQCLRVLNWSVSKYLDDAKIKAIIDFKDWE